MKIAMLGHKRIPSREGGVEVVVEELATRMAKKGHDVVCYNRSGKHVAGNEFSNESLKEYKGIKLKKTFTIDKKGLAAMSSSFFASIKALFSKAKVVHYHAEGPCAMMWIIKWFSRKKIVATIHGLDWQRAKWGGFATKYIKFGEKMAVKYADEIIVLSENVKNYFKETYNRETVFIPNGVSKHEIKAAKVIKKKYNLKKDDYILYLGRVVPEKGIHYLIEAFSKIKTNKKLVIAGGASDTDSYYSEIKEMAKKDNRIILTGFVQGEELNELFSNAYIYCLPSDLEGMPLSLLEAMSYSNCCLTSNIDECSEVLEDKGVTFEKSNVKDLEEKLNNLILNEDKVKEYKDNAQEFILNKYNWDDVTNKTLDVYEIKKKNINKGKIGPVLLILSVIFMLIINIFKLFNIFSYIILLSLISLGILMVNNFRIISPNILFLAYFLYVIGLGPIFLMQKGIFYNYNYHNFILGPLLAFGFGNMFFKEKKINQKVKNKFKINFSRKKIIYILYAISVVFTLIYLIKNVNLLFTGDIQNGRVTAVSGNGLLLYGMKLPIALIPLLIDMYYNAKNNKNLLMIKKSTIIIMTIISFILLILPGYRINSLTLLVCIIIMLAKKLKFSNKKIIMCGLGFIVVVTLLGYLRASVSGGKNTISNSFVQSLYTNCINLEFVSNTFPNKVPFQHGYTYLINLKMLLPGPDPDFTLWLKEQTGVVFSGGGLTPTLIGEFYLNFGRTSAYLGFFIMGIIGNILLRKYDNENGDFLSTYYVWQFAHCISGGISNVMIHIIIFTIVYKFCIIFSDKKVK